MGEPREWQLGCSTSLEGWVSNGDVNTSMPTSLTNNDMENIRVGRTKLR